MARFLALDWDRLEARIVVARTQGDSVTIDQVASAPIQLDGQDNNFDGLETQLSKVLSSLRLSKSQVLTAIGRSAIELRTLKLPPAPDDELPDMVRFQAMREFSSLKEESPLDFLPLGSAAQESGEVMAAAIPLELSTQLESAITGQGHEVTRSVMRPCSAASLAMRRQPSAASGVTLVIAQQADSAELAVARNGIVVFTRSFRLPSDWHPGATGEPLLGEVRRTIVAAQNQLSGSSIERIVMFGSEAEHSGLRDRLHDRTKLEVTLLDPFAGHKVAGAQPEQPERFAALIGMLHDEAAAVRPAFDFKNPRRRPVPESNRRQNVLYAAMAATVLLGLMFLVWWQHRGLDQQISKQTFMNNELARENKRLTAKTELATELNDWKKGDRNWLDELLYLSTSEGLTPDDFRIETLTASTRRSDRKGIVSFRARAKDPKARQKLQSALRDDDHQVGTGPSSKNERQDKRYPIEFTTDIEIERHFSIAPPPLHQQAPKPDASEPASTENNEQESE